MKKFILFLTVCLLLPAAVGCAAKQATAASVGIANPWQDVTAEQAKAAVGDSFVPKNGEEAVYSVNTAIGMAQTVFTDANGIEWCCRVQATDGATDISGMYYTFDKDNCGFDSTVTVGEITLTQLAAPTEDGTAYVAYYYDGSCTHCFSAVTAVTPIVLPL